MILPGAGPVVVPLLQIDCVEEQFLAVAYTFLNLFRVRSLGAELGALFFIILGARLLL